MGYNVSSVQTLGVGCSPAAREGRLVWFRNKKARIEPKTVLSPEMAKLWSYLTIRYLVLATPVSRLWRR